jgi:spermidine synthase
MTKRKPRTPPSSDSPSRADTWLWLVTSFVAGAVVMSMELAAFRLYAPHFGYSIYVWGNLIAVVMGAIGLGLALGGRWADRALHDGGLYWAFLAAGLCQLVTVLAAPGWLSALAGLGEMAGSVLATLLLMAPAMILLSFASPFVVRLHARAGGVGRSSGMFQAVNTLGGICGVLLTAFVLVPHFGTQHALSVNCGLTLLVAAIGLGRRRALGLGAAAPLALLPFAPAPALPSDTVMAVESPYNHVVVRRKGDLVALSLNNPAGIQTLHRLSGDWTGNYYDDFAVGPLLVSGRRVLVLGMGAGESIAATRRTAPNALIDAVEIDPRVVEAADRFFQVRPDPPRLRIEVADARPWLVRNAGPYDLVHADLFQGGPFVPFYLVTREFFELVRSRMSDDSVLMVNAYDAGPRREIVSALAATLKTVFPTVLVRTREPGNHLLLAFSAPTTQSAVQSLLGSLDPTHPAHAVARDASAALWIPSPSGTAPVLTDDHCPIEAMIQRMLRHR